MDVTLVFHLLIVVLGHEVVHILAAYESHVLAVQQDWLFRGKLDHEETALGVPHVHEHHCPMAILELGYSIVGVVACYAEPIVKQGHLGRVKYDLAASLDDFALVVGQVGGNSEVVSFWL